MIETNDVFEAIKKDNKAEVQKFINKGFVLTKTLNGENALICAAKNQSGEVLELLLSKDIDLDYTCNGKTAKDIIKDFIVDAETEDNKKHLKNMLSAIEKREPKTLTKRVSDYRLSFKKKVVLFIISLSFSYDIYPLIFLFTKNENLLMFWSRPGSLAVFHEWLSYIPSGLKKIISWGAGRFGVELNLDDSSDSLSSILYFFNYGSTLLENFLISEAGYDKVITDKNSDGNTALMLAAQGNIFSSKPNVATLEILSDYYLKKLKPSLIYAKNNKNQTTLDFVMSSGYCESLKSLLEKISVIKYGKDYCGYDEYKADYSRYEECDKYVYYRQSHYKNKYKNKEDFLPFSDTPLMIVLRRVEEAETIIFSLKGCFKAEMANNVLDYNYFGVNALMVAAAHHDLAVLEVMFETVVKKAMLDKYYPGSNIKFNASLLEPNYYNSIILPALSITVKKDKKEESEYLKSYLGDGALHYAIKNGDFDILNFLLESPVLQKSIDTVDTKGNDLLMLTLRQTPSCLAERKARLSAIATIIDIKIKAAADDNAKLRVKDKFLVRALEYAAIVDDYFAFETILNGGINSEKNIRKDSQLHMLVYYGSENLIKYFFEYTEKYRYFTVGGKGDLDLNYIRRRAVYFYRKDKESSTDSEVYMLISNKREYKIFNLGGASDFQEYFSFFGNKYRWVEEIDFNDDVGLLDSKKYSRENLESKINLIHQDEMIFRRGFSRENIYQLNLDGDTPLMSAVKNPADDSNGKTYTKNLVFDELVEHYEFEYKTTDELYSLPNNHDVNDAKVISNINPYLSVAADNKSWGIVRSLLEKQIRESVERGSESALLKLARNYEYWELATKLLRESHPNNHDFFQAAYSLDFLGIIRHELNKMEAQDKQGRTVLMLALEEGNEAIFFSLTSIEENKITSIDIEGNNILMRAIEAQKRDAINWLLCGDLINLEEENISKQTPLLIAVEKEDDETVKLLLEANVSPNVKNREGKTPLMIAAQLGNKTIMKTLLQYDAQLDFFDEHDGMTALDIAAYAKQWELVDIILAKKLTLDNYKNTLLMLAVWQNNEEVVHYLLGKEDTLQEINKKNRSKKTALDVAIHKGNPEIIQALLTKKAESGDTSDETQLIILACQQDDGKAKQLLASLKNIHPQKLDIALNLAVTSENWEIADLILAEKVSRSKIENYTELMAAVDSGSVPLVDNLLTETDAAKTLNQVNGEGNTAFIIAIRQNHRAIVELLLQEKTLDISKTAQGGLTIFQLAANQQDSLLSYLLQHENLKQAYCSGIAKPVKGINPLKALESGKVYSGGGLLDDIAVEDDFGIGQYDWSISSTIDEYYEYKASNTQASTSLLVALMLPGIAFAAGVLMIIFFFHCLRQRYATRTDNTDSQRRSQNPTNQALQEENKGARLN